MRSYLGRQRGVVPRAAAGAIVFVLALALLPVSVSSQQPETVTWMTTTALPTIIEDATKRFMAQNPQIRIVWRPTPSGKIRDVALSTLVANPDDLDVVAIMYGDLASFVKAGMLTNLEGLTWSGDFKKALTTSARVNSSYKGVLYGIPYFHAIHIYVYNTRLLKEAGITALPRTWDEYTKTLVALRDKRKKAPPLVLPWNVASSSDSIHWSWEMFTASRGGKLWDKAYKPLFLEPSSPGYQAFKWMVDGLRLGLIDRTSFEMDAGKISELLARGEAPLGAQVSLHDLVRFNVAPSQEAGNFVVAAAPDKGINVARTDIFAPTSRARARGERHWQAVETFLRWLADPKNMIREYGAMNARGLSFRAFETDPEVQASWAKWVSLDEVKRMMPKLTTYAEIVPQYMEPYFPELRDAMNQELQKALLGRQTVDQALQAIAKRAQDLGAGR